MCELILNLGLQEKFQCALYSHLASLQNPDIGLVLCLPNLFILIRFRYWVYQNYFFLLEAKLQHKQEDPGVLDHAPESWLM